MERAVLHHIISETCVGCIGLDMLATIVDRRLGSLCSIYQGPEDAEIQFDDGRVILKKAGNMLMIRVQANDLISSHSIKTVLEGCLVEAYGLKQMALPWIVAKTEPFVALADYAAATKRRI